ncbi:lysine 2,3-aminomutase [Haematobacter massiliensis]|uniref:Lysine 2,3-aminomutase n=2 Tax=Haematobacter massiliensis TaxID=195105 RepID=A0A086YCK1_9RHOB|nr:lysine-2,3-aminomutase-like protein [Haematobacter massiliensis]KFI32001.1 lysine 2,3-aminomutase [Haematobacter massiliensis]OWJ72604.1 lysine 2,3-aminomutase [Haematobacter massiliensis]OWJ87944.1 lysine 2,3-aminomutase [Haematobacter massiliensis]QBJ24386.1 lysine-2,3-aminomutase-like protein [Haematobacter massiliensis]
MSSCPPRPARALTTLADLRREALIPEAAEAPLAPVAEAFRIRLTPAVQRSLGETTEPGVALQYVPTTAELTILPEELADPIGDAAHSPVKGLTHRYPDRVILHITQTCEVYCRFCFRREAVGGAGTLSEAEIEAALAYVGAHPAIWEVILTGGDPMVLSARRMGQILSRIAAIPHVEIIRFHTRVPVVAPERIDDALLGALNVRPQVMVVVHTNHPAEMTAEAAGALSRLAGAGIILRSQSVLLRGVNDDADTLEALFRGLVRNRVQPYYLHHCDLARGTGHFRTTIAEGQSLMEELRGRLSGHCLPTYVLDIPGGYGKVPIGPGYVTEGLEPGSHVVTDPKGGRHDYHDPLRPVEPTAVECPKPVG